MQTMKTYLYRIEIKNKHGQDIKHLAVVKSEMDENARRKIIHDTIQSGGRVVSISETDDDVKYPGDGKRKDYGFG